MALSRPAGLDSSCKGLFPDQSLKITFYHLKPAAGQRESPGASVYKEKYLGPKPADLLNPLICWVHLLRLLKS